MGATNQGREKIGGKNVQRIMQNTKMNEHKKRPYKGVTLMHAYRWKDDQKNSQKGLMTKNKGS